MTTSGRMLQLLSLLQTHRFWQGGELAGRLEVSERTVRRDIDRLRGLGYPVDAVRGAAGGYQLKAGAALPPLLLDDEEAVAIAVGLRAAAGGMVAGIEETSARALAKLVQVMPPRLRRRVDALQAATVPVSLPGPTVHSGVLATLAQACRDAERVRFGYTSYDGQETRRHVEPHRLVSLGRRWYLVGYDLTRHDWRGFRLDRVRQSQTTGERFRPRDLPAADAAAFVQESLRSVPQQHEVSVLVDAPGERLRTAAGRWADVEELGADRCRVRMRVDDLAWPTMLLTCVGAPFRVESPPALVDYLAAARDLWDASVTR